MGKLNQIKKKSCYRYNLYKIEIFSCEKEMGINFQKVDETSALSYELNSLENKKLLLNILEKNVYESEARKTSKFCESIA